jgi:hypothetical protein
MNFQKLRRSTMNSAARRGRTLYLIDMGFLALILYYCSSVSICGGVGSPAFLCGGAGVPGVLYLKLISKCPLYGIREGLVLSLTSTTLKGVHHRSHHRAKPCEWFPRPRCPSDQPHA